MKEKMIDTILPLITVAAVILIAVVIGSCLGNRDSPPGSYANVRQVTAEQTNSNSVNAETSKSLSGSISIPGFERIIIKAGQLNQEIKLYNPQKNNCYFQISIYLSEGTEIFRSGLLAPGKALNSIKLAHALQQGTYKGAFLRYSCYSIADLQPLNGADINFTLEVEP